MDQPQPKPPAPAEIPLPLFIYEALDSDGKRVKGARNAANEDAVRESLRELGYTLAAIRLHRPPARPEDIGVLARRLLRFVRKVFFRRTRG